MGDFFKKSSAVLCDLFVYFTMTLIGVITMIISNSGLEKPILYSSVIFFIVGLLSFGGYFYTTDNKKTYELLFLSLVSIITGVYFFIFKSYDVSIVLGTGYLIFSLLNMVSKLYYSFKLKKFGNELWLLKAISILLLLFISILVVQNFYRTFTHAQNIVVGYYFISYGFISFFEVLLISRISPNEFKKVMDGNFLNNKKMKNINKLDSAEEELNKIVKNKKSLKK